MEQVDDDGNVIANIQLPPVGLANSPHNVTSAKKPISALKKRSSDVEHEYENVSSESDAPALSPVRKPAVRAATIQIDDVNNYPLPDNDVADDDEAAPVPEVPQKKKRGRKKKVILPYSPSPFANDCTLDHVEVSAKTRRGPLF